MRSRKQPRDRVKNKARQSREQKSAANTTIRNKQLCAARGSDKAPKQSVYPDLVQRLRAARDLENAPKRVYPDLVQHLCAAGDLEKAAEQRFTLSIVFNIYVLQEV